MQELAIEEIKSKAHKFHNDGVRWHFHILTPGCSFNNKSKYAFVLECPDKKEAYIYYSDSAEKTLGQELSPLLHGAKILNKETAEASYQPSETVSIIISRAKALNKDGIEWHHHMLFPDCRFNTHKPKFALIFEDPGSRETLVSLTSEEPTNDLKQIEPLLYKK